MRTFIKFLLFSVICFTTSYSFATGTISITATHDTICRGSWVTFTATAFGYTHPHYQWTKNSITVGSDSTGFSTDSLNNSDVIMCLLDTVAGGSIVQFSAPIVMTVYSIPHVSMITGNDTLCRFATDTLRDSVSGGTWFVSNTGFAHVNTSGIVTGTATGADTVYYEDSNMCGISIAMKSIFINRTPVLGPITGTNTLCVGSSSTLFTDSIAGGSWSSSNSVVASIDSIGNVTPVSLGIATITYSLSNSCGTTNRTRNVNVRSAPTTTPINGTLSFCQSDTVHLNVMAGPGGTWNSSNNTICLINPIGGGGGGFGGANAVAFGISAGSVLVSYTTTNACGTAVDTVTLTINPLPVVYPIIGSDSVCPSSSVTYIEYATGGTWAISNTILATISSFGVATASATAGIDTISYSLTNACGTTTQELPIYIYCSSHSGVEMITNKENIDIFPNPTFDIINIDGTTPASIQILNMYGQILKSEKNTNHVSIADLSSGIYFIQLFDNNGLIKLNKRIVKK